MSEIKISDQHLDSIILFIQTSQHLYEFKQKLMSAHDAILGGYEGEAKSQIERYKGDVDNQIRVLTELYSQMGSNLGTVIQQAMELDQTIAERLRLKLNDAGFK